ncbi:DUF397 domain-containing protein [Frankia sp. R43]|uniref:DUF397 domain-containing protein n=1 Tax=Frankia sp. R43 TaxID=269536 RepID=UPI0006CA53A0|nr:DUF397 domain-containing protein [Frankia sp. R43]
MKTYDPLMALGREFPLPSWGGEPLVWRRASGAGSSALEVASVCGLGVALREAGRAEVPPLLVPAVEWSAFVEALGAAEFPDLTDPGGGDGPWDGDGDDETWEWGDDDDYRPVADDDESYQ